MASDGVTRRVLCATGLGAVAVTAATPVMGQAPLGLAPLHHYGPHSRQTLYFFNGRGRGPRPLVVMAGDARPVSRSQARPLIERGISVALIDRREPRHGFNAHTSDLARAVSYLMVRQEALELDGRLAFWGEGAGAEAVLLTLRDRRYLAAVNMVPRSVWGAVLLSQLPVQDTTFTRAEAYGAGDPAGILHTKKATEGAAFLSGLF